MKIAQVVCVFPPYRGGMGQSVYDIADNLAGLGEDVTVFTPNYFFDTDDIKILRYRDIKNFEDFKVVKIKPWLNFGNGAFIPGLLRYIKDYDVVHLHYPFFGGAEVVWFAKKVLKYKFKLVLHYHMDALKLRFPANILRWPSDLLASSLFNISDAIVCSSEDYIANSVVKEYYIKHKNKFFEIPFGMDVNRFYPAQTRQSTLLICHSFSEGGRGYSAGAGSQQQNPPTPFAKGGMKNPPNPLYPFDPAQGRQGGVRILFVGGLDKAHYFKGLSILLKALADLKNFSWQLDIVGDGDLKEEYRRQAESFLIADRVKFCGKLSDDELPKAYRNSSFLVLPSINAHEAFGIVLIEAMASGLPVIASNLPGVRTVFDNNKSGFLVKPGDKDSLRDALKMLIVDENLILKMGGEAHNTAVEKYDMKKIMQKYLDIYNICY